MNKDEQNPEEEMMADLAQGINDFLVKSFDTLLQQRPSDLQIQQLFVNLLRIIAYSRGKKSQEVALEKLVEIIEKDPLSVDNHTLNYLRADLASEIIPIAAQQALVNLQNSKPQFDFGQHDGPSKTFRLQ